MPKLSPGDRLTKIHASEWNGFIDAANWVRQNAQNLGGDAPRTSRGENLVLVQNDSGAVLDAFTPVSLTDLAVKPDQTTGAPLMGAMPAFTANKPSSTNAGKPVAILQEPLAVGKCGKAMLSGISLCRVEIGDAEHSYADVNYDSGSLTSIASGAFQLLWKPEGTGSRLVLAQFPVPVDYQGMFAVIPVNADSVKIVDGSATESSAPAGKALVNGELFSVDTVTLSFDSSTTSYLYLEGTSTGSTINPPTLKSETTFPEYEEGKCHVLLARVIKGRIVQEHHGMVYATIWGDCES